MTIARSVLRFSAIGTLALSLSGSAFASSATLDGTTGPDSNNTVSTTNTWTNTVTNDNSVTIVNANIQLASSGDAKASENTTVGDVASGDSANNNTTNTAVTIDNSGSGGSGGDNGGNGGDGNTGGSGGSTGGAGGSGGSVLGASTGGSGSGVSTLPEVGASVPMDVSALRALYHVPVAALATPALVKTATGLSPYLLGLAALMSLLGALGTSLFNRRRERLVN